MLKRPGPGDLVCIRASSLVIRYGTNEERWIRGPFIGLVLATKGTARQRLQTDGELVDWYVVLFSQPVADDLLDPVAAGVYMVPPSDLVKIGHSDTQDGVRAAGDRWTG